MNKTSQTSPIREKTHEGHAEGQPCACGKTADERRDTAKSKGRDECCGGGCCQSA